MQDSFLLFDNLHDTTVESIDAYSLFEFMQQSGLKSYYVTLKDSALHKKLIKNKKMDNIIVINESPRKAPDDFFRILTPTLLKTKCIITAFDINAKEIQKFFKNNKNWTYIFIQHGPTYLKESVLTCGYLYPDKFDKYLVSSDYEFNLLKKYGKVIIEGLKKSRYVPHKFLGDSKLLYKYLLANREYGLAFSDEFLKFNKNLILIFKTS